MLLAASGFLRAKLRHSCPDARAWLSCIVVVVVTVAIKHEKRGVRESEATSPTPRDRPPAILDCRSAYQSVLAYELSAMPPFLLVYSASTVWDSIVRIHSLQCHCFLAGGTEVDQIQLLSRLISVSLCVDRAYGCVIVDLDATPLQF